MSRLTKEQREEGLAYWKAEGPRGQLIVDLFADLEDAEHRLEQYESHTAICTATGGENCDCADIEINAVRDKLDIAIEALEKLKKCLDGINLDWITGVLAKVKP